ncbi:MULTISPECIES: S-layer homology domain-containing protein [unclassified Paenibacillus]|uniref:S-layer homology domain-containing protein n=1 Tax=unclassified Paenibacillus TaxID=185978 RepID=UPI0003E26294|nr:MULTISPECIES: S-layer homology domain-containing protein [unclassified Paenibacillus]ETT43595.1 hypothetical protein C162_24710 [Paenibacillus sp. FSL R7-269]OMF94879.1 hypothetical protein BK147_15985 [Paenibacillus sp. FSL R7-0337]
MKKKLISILALMSLLTCLISPFYASAEASKVPIRDMQTHYWSSFLKSELQPEYSDRVWEYGGYDYSSTYAGQKYYVRDLQSYKLNHFILYDNGDLFLSSDENMNESSFSKIMSNVKSISKIDVPYLKSREIMELQSARLNYNKDSYSVVSDIESVTTVQLSTILTNDGELYIMGSPTDIPDINKKLFIENKNVIPKVSVENKEVGGRHIQQTISISMLFPFAYQASSNTAVKIAENIDYINPSYYSAENLVYKINPNYNGGNGFDQINQSPGYKGFFIDKLGNTYIGFPGQNEFNTLAAPNIVNHSNNSNIKLLEDGTLYRNDNKVSNDIKDFTTDLYLKNNGTLYVHADDYERGIIDRDVKYIFEDYYYKDGGRWSEAGGYYIKNDDSLWFFDYNDSRKLMDDVSYVFEGFVIRTNGEVYILEKGENDTLLPRKIMNGNGLAPKPAAKLHEGKIFKDASDWALVDLRSARTSGLTLPVKDLSYNKAITREKFCEIAVKLYEKSTQKSAPLSSKNTFKDTKNPEILKAYELGIVKGTSEITFSPQATITREEVATMLKRAVDKAGKTIEKGSAKNFSDQAKISSWAKEAVSAMSAANIVKGLSENTFAPKQNTTIEQAIIMANRLVK